MRIPARRHGTTVCACARLSWRRERVTVFPERRDFPGVRLIRCSCGTMYQTMEIFMARKKRVQERVLPNTYRIFNENLFDASLDQSKIIPPVVFKKADPPVHPRSPNRNNMPHPYHAKFIRDNVRFLNEPITYMLTTNTKHQQTQWWPSHEEHVNIRKPSYDLMTTQRSDFGRMTYSTPRTRHGCNPHKSPLHGIGKSLLLYRITIIIKGSHSACTAVL
ncbi:hypothetical protein GDO81_008581 [Engystomops pustulosus]|uniref:Uncharacterized protein n=1 Tax=Engystomops pustulosus TaxID=76066 RepID=A0AAV7CFN9_ENGPU|nr:hypothetical protein GDO81_008581 [Engystomops pustulosus]